MIDYVQPARDLLDHGERAGILDTLLPDPTKGMVVEALNPNLVPYAAGRLAPKILQGRDFLTAVGEIPKDSAMLTASLAMETQANNGSLSCLTASSDGFEGVGVIGSIALETPDKAFVAGAASSVQTQLTIENIPNLPNSFGSRGIPVNLDIGPRTRLENLAQEIQQTVKSGNGFGKLDLKLNDVTKLVKDGDDNKNSSLKQIAKKFSPNSGTELSSKGTLGCPSQAKASKLLLKLRLRGGPGSKYSSPVSHLNDPDNLYYLTDKKKKLEKPSWLEKIFRIPPGGEQSLLNQSSNQTVVIDLNSEKILEKKLFIKSVFKSIRKFRKEIIMVFILGGMVYICFRKPKKVKKFFQRLFKFYQKFNKFRSRKIFNNSIFRLVWVFYKYRPVA